jgi:peptidoglycan/LPS O-acetylase OafA/YrhL
MAPISPHALKERGRLVWLEAGRAIAAFFVVLHHAD